MLPLLCEPSALHAMIDSAAPSELLVVDLGTEERFFDQHIPNAVHVHPAETQACAPIPGLLPDNETLGALIQRIGLTANRHVVVYDDEGGGWAGRFIWLLDEIGHTHYSYLNGGLLAWTGDGYLCEQGPDNTRKTAPKPLHKPIQTNHRHSVTLSALGECLTDQQTCIWDARSPTEYRGESRNAMRAGHIPGAINYEWTQAMDPGRHYRLKPLNKLKSELAALGITADKKIITHCQSHHRSGLTYLVAKLLGFSDVKAYPGSWCEWGNRDDTPIEC